MDANTRAPSTGCQKPDTGSLRKPASTPNNPRHTITASRPHASPSTANTGSDDRPEYAWGGTWNSGPGPAYAACTPAATADATASGTNARGENSNSSSSIASTTDASGAPNVAAMPAAAPDASRIL